MNTVSALRAPASAFNPQTILPASPPGVPKKTLESAPGPLGYSRVDGMDEASSTRMAATPGTHRVTVSSMAELRAAIKNARPGTDIMVKAGTYHGSLNLSGLHGTQDKPIRLISADGPGKAKIIGSPNSATIQGYGISHVGIHGFHVVSTSTSGDYGGFKLWGPWNKPAENIVLSGNTISGQGCDAIKFFSGSRNIKVLGNTIEGKWRQEAMDFFSVENSVVGYNTFNHKARFSSITMKGGARNIELVGNDFRADTSSEIIVGGIGDFDRWLPKGYWKTGWQASHVNIHDNAISGPSSVFFMGGVNSTVTHNTLGGSVSTQGKGGDYRRRNEPSRNNSVHDNTGARGPVGPKALPASYRKLLPGG